MVSTVKNRLFELINAKEGELGRRITHKEIAEDAGVTTRMLTRWLNPDSPPQRFDAHAIVGLCQYFGVGVGDLLVIDDTERDTAA